LPLSDDEDDDVVKSAKINPSCGNSLDVVVSATTCCIGRWEEEQDEIPRSQPRTPLVIACWDDGDRLLCAWDKLQIFARNKMRRRKRKLVSDLIDNILLQTIQLSEF
jgi:hypothetical protein